MFKKIAIAFAVFVGLQSFYVQKNLKWVAIGDSITYLNEHINETGNRISKGYMTKVTERLPHVTYSNQGHNGWTSGGIAENIEKLGIEKADIYSIFLGTNDWWQGRPLGSIADYQNNSGNKTVFGSFRIIIEKLKQLNKDAHIILITPMQRTDFVYIADAKNNAYGSYKEKNGQSLSAFAAAIKSIAEFEHFDLVDLFNCRKISIKKLVKFKRMKDPQTGVYKNYRYPDFIEIPFNPLTDEYPYPLDAIDMTYDGLHPSENGYAFIARRIVKIMKKY